jgi:hypothetical protein
VPSHPSIFILMSFQMLLLLLAMVYHLHSDNFSSTEFGDQ